MESYHQQDLTTKENLDGIQKKLGELLSTAELSGVSPIVNSRGYCRKIAKLIIVIVGLVGFYYQTFEFLDIYWQYLTISTSSPLDKMKKPEITICDNNILSSAYLCRHTKLSEKCQTLEPSVYHKCGRRGTGLHPYCVPPHFSLDNKVLPEIHFEYDYDLHANLTRKAGFQYYTMVLLCQWTHREIKNDIHTHETKTNCSQPKYMRGITKEDKYPAACYTLKSVETSRKNANDYFSGDSGLTMALKWKFSDFIIPSMLLPRTLRSYWISIHRPGNLRNPFVDGFEVFQGNHYDILVSQVDNVRLPSPYSSHCYDYVDAWKKNKSHGPLSREECEKTCEIDESFSKYGCVPYSVTHPHDKPLCVKVHRNDFTLENAIDTCVQNCRDACRETDYIATLRLNRKLNLSEIFKKYDTPLVIKLQFHFQVSNSTTVTERPVYQTVEVFSYIGGFLGIWLGWSLAAIFELVEISFSALVNYLYLKYSQ